ncbi:uncharacterized protein FIBRA_00487 [Fibroporia radiculosa]|uniref:Peptidase M24 domain-containing protein n=1 Tax=Fibroporia radiculosa TaxID=599839 RepID=J4H032_9APHY|nr:uncharacterized protein FIBRA_00487 [Fibroporia radiculosa]CCL98489.1 predicted protein [Fibroporia radiculosa]
MQLFIPKVEIADLMWSVPPPTPEEALQAHQVTRIENLAALPGALNEQLKAYPDAAFHILPANSPLFPTLPAEYAALILSNNVLVTDKYLLTAVHRARLTKDHDEIEAIKKATAISSRAHEVVMRVLGQGVRGAITRGKGAGVGRPLLPSEWLIEKEAEAEALFVASCRREGSIHQAYLPIVAASTRASTLHYCCNDREFAWGPVPPNVHENGDCLSHDETRQLHPQVLLIDAACEWDCYASDITRTMPVGNGGKFTPEARAIYELVLEMQKLSMEALKPGVHWDVIQLLCHRTLVRGFQRLGIFLNPNSPNSGSWNAEEAILASGVSSAFYPHGVGHSLGLDVHDVPSASKPEKNDTLGKGVEIGHESFYTYLRLRLPLEEGMVVTVEPGVYFSPHLLAPVRDSRHIDHNVLRRYESVGGVRIEDVVLITRGGSENLTTVRSDPDWIEANGVSQVASSLAGSEIPETRLQDLPLGSLSVLAESLESLIISKAEKSYIQTSLHANPPLRADGRSLLDFRTVLLETGVAPLANGSAKLNVGKIRLEGGGGTEVLAAAKLEVEDVQQGDGVDGGRIACSVTCSPAAYPYLTSNALDELQYDMTAVLHQTLSHPSLHPKNLGILPGKKSWLLSLDVVVLADAGNVYDAVFMASRAALWDTKVPRTRPIQYQARGSTLAPRNADVDMDGDASEQQATSGFDTRDMTKTAADFELPDYWDEGEVLDSRDIWPVCVTLNMSPPIHFLDATPPEEASTPLKLMLAFSFPLGSPCSLQAMRLLGPGELTTVQLRALIAEGEKYARDIFTALEAKLHDEDARRHVKARDKFAVR